VDVRGSVGALAFERVGDQLARLEVRYPEVHLVFADSRRYAEDWTYRFLTTARADATDLSPNGG
jgi:hypothetical protein